MVNSSAAQTRRVKLDQLVELEGFDSLDDLLAATITDSVSPAICLNDGCDYTEEKEPDSREGWCEECQRGTMVSALVLAGII